MKVLALVVAAMLIGAPTLAQVRSAPQPAPMPPPIPAPKDVLYPGQIKLAIDATDTARRIFQIKETIPVKAGPMTLLYARWVPGHHREASPIYQFGGLKITGGGAPIRWTRDPVDVYAFHIEVPKGVTEIQVDAQLLSATEAAQGVIAVSPDMTRVMWYALGLYPAGYFTRQIQVEASVKLPAGYEFATALETAATTGQVTTFKPTSYEVLVDSPLIAGRYVRRYDLDPGGRSRVTLNVVAEGPEYLEAKPEIIERHREMVRQADKLYGARHFDHYDVLLWLTNQLSGAGIEHHRSTEIGTDPKYFTTWDTAFISRETIPHEYNHSWDGKYRRPADLWTPNLDVPMRGSLLWVYEGQDQYFGSLVMSARAGMLTRQESLDNLALTAASLSYRVAREWRPLQDTTIDPIIAARRAQPWPSWQRSEDYYREGMLIWLDADTLIRERSGGARSLDDFARAFYGMNEGDWGVLTYTFEDVVATLNKVEPYDWTSFLRKRLDDAGAPPPLDGIRRGGYRLVYTDTQTAYAKALETRAKTTDLTYSIGVVVDTAGKFSAVQWDGPVFKAGLTIGTQLVAVNGVAFDADRLKAAVKATGKGGPPIQLLIKQGDLYRTVAIDYVGGLRYPRLEKVEGAPALLDAILAPR